MRAKRYSAEQIVAKLREAEKLQAQGLTIPQSCKRLGISDQTFYRWRIKYGALKEDEAQRLKAMEQENARLKKFIAVGGKARPRETAIERRRRGSPPNAGWSYGGHSTSDSTGTHGSLMGHILPPLSKISPTASLGGRGLCEAGISAGTERHEVVHVDQSQDPSSRDRNEAPGRIGDSLRATKLDRLSACLDLAASRREDVPDPVAVRSVGKREHVPITVPKHVHRSAVEAARPTPDVGHDRKPRHPGGEVARDAVRHTLVEAGYTLGDRHRRCRTDGGSRCAMCARSDRELEQNRSF